MQATRGLLALHRCKVEICPCLMDFSLADSLLISLFLKGERKFPMNPSLPYFMAVVRGPGRGDETFEEERKLLFGNKCDAEIGKNARKFMAENRDATSGGKGTEIILRGCEFIHLLDSTLSANKTGNGTVMGGPAGFLRFVTEGGGVVTSPEEFIPGKGFVFAGSKKIRSIHQFRAGVL